MSRSSPLPPIEDLLAELSDISEVEVLDPDAPLEALEELGVDSLDLLEWLYGIGDRYGIAVDEALFEGLADDATLRSLYEGVGASEAAGNLDEIG